MDILNMKRQAIHQLTIKDPNTRFYFAARVLPLVAKFVSKIKGAWLRARAQRKIHAVSMSKQKFFSLAHADAVDIERQANNLQGQCRYSKQWIQPEDNLEVVYGALCARSLSHSKSHFSIAEGCLLVKEKASSDSTRYKHHFSKITKISIVVEKKCLCFLHDGLAWALNLESEEVLKKWANVFIYMREEAIQETQALKFPIFEVAPTYTGRHLEFPKEKQRYEYKPMVFKKTMENLFKVFDTSNMQVADADLAPKRERSVEVLSDSD